MNDGSALGGLARERRAILLCGGEATRWQGHLGVRKHLVDIDGSPLLRDTIAKLRARGVTDIAVVARSEDYRFEGTSYHAIPDIEVDAPRQKFLSSQDLWLDEGETLLMFGDVFFSDAAMDIITAPTGGLISYTGRLHASRITGCSHGEIFAVCFDAARKSAFLAAVNQVPNSAEKAKRPTGWMTYDILADRAAAGMPDATVGVVFHHVDDFTDDFDYPSDYENWKRARVARKITRYDPRKKAKVWKGRAHVALAAGAAFGLALGLVIGGL